MGNCKAMKRKMYQERRRVQVWRMTVGESHGRRIIEIDHWLDGTIVKVRVRKEWSPSTEKPEKCRDLRLASSASMIRRESFIEIVRYYFITDPSLVCALIFFYRLASSYRIVSHERNPFSKFKLIVKNSRNIERFSRSISSTEFQF